MHQVTVIITFLEIHLLSLCLCFKVKNIPLLRLLLNDITVTSQSWAFCVLLHKFNKSFKDISQLHPNCTNTGPWGEEPWRLTLNLPRLTFARKAPQRKQSKTTSQSKSSRVSWFPLDVLCIKMIWTQINSGLYWCLAFKGSALVFLPIRTCQIAHSSSAKNLFCDQKVNHSVEFFTVSFFSSWYKSGHIKTTASLLHWHP